MKPKNKAKELVNKFREQTDGIAPYNYDDVNKQCALIAVDEMLPLCSPTRIMYKEVNEYLCGFFLIEYTEHKYWEEVKKEIEKL